MCFSFLLKLLLFAIQAGRKNDRSFPISQDGKHLRSPLQLPLRTRHTRDLTFSNGVRKFHTNKELALKGARLRSLISQNADARSLERLTDDLENLTELLKSREEKAQQDVVEDDSDKRGQSTKGKISYNQYTKPYI